MIRYACPRCKAVLESPDRKAGQKVHCPGCGQRLQIPLPPRNRTVLAPLVPAPPPEQAGTQPVPAASYPRAVPVQPPPAWPAPPPPAPIIAPAVMTPLERRSARLLFRRRLLIWGFCFTVVVGTVAAVIAVAVRAVPALFPPAGAVAEDRPNPRSQEEELVRRFVVNNAEDAKAVRFLRWGPHMTGDELLALIKESGVEGLVTDEAKAREAAKKLKTVTLVRVRYRDPNAFPGVGPMPFLPVPAPAGDTGKRDEPHDCIFVVMGKLVYPTAIPNAEGDRWKAAFRKQLAKVFPAIDAERP
ncbi:MAG TPA: hypothetical protein VJ739_13480 [Gemmataceae bacterium]|nr:hypothetical protein [Gemmataceae bacterium]